MSCKSPIKWYGGKYYQAKDIIKLFPEHKSYVEVFGGAGHILFRKEPSEIETFNDIDSGLYNFFKVLRSDDTYNELVKKLELTPYSREEFVNCLETWQSENDIVEKVRKWYVCIIQSFSCDFST